METRANYLAVGLFTLAAAAVTLALIYWFGRYGEDQNLVPLDVRIQGSVSGLGAGSSVQFNGIDVGRVIGLSLDNDDPRFVVVRTEVNANTPVRSDTRANIGIRGISGGAFIQLEGGSPNARQLLDEGTETGAVPRIKGDPAALADLLVRINGIAVRTERVMDTLENFVTVNNETVSTTFSNLKTFSAALAANSSGVEKFMSSAGKVAIALEGFSSKMDGSLSQVEKILAAVDANKITSTVDNIQAFSQSVADEREQISEMVKAAAKTASDLQNFSSGLNQTLKRVDGVVASLDPARVASVIQNIDETAKRANALIAEINAQNVSKAVDDIAQTAASARRLVQSIDQQVVTALMTDLAAAGRSVNTLVAAIDAARVNNAVENFSKAASGAQTVVADVSKVTSKFGARAGDIDKIVSDAAQLAERLNGTSIRIDGVVAQVENLLGKGQVDGIASEVSSTLAQFRETARVFNLQISQVASGINKFTKSGLADTQGLISDARRSLDRFDRVIRNLQNNPSSLISGAGGSRVRETPAGRPRR